MNEKSKPENARRVRQLFDNWAENNRDVGMQEGHSYAVKEALKKVNLPEPLQFLDIGCGNGWLVRQIASNYKYSIGIGIDTSGEMINKARQMTTSENIQYFNKDILEWNPDHRFNFIISMEAFYYVVPIEKIMKRLPSLLQPEGVVLIGVDYYAENPVSQDWQDQLSVKLDRRSKNEWCQLLENIGIKVNWQEQIKYPDKPVIADWKKQYGSLFTCGTFYP